MHDITRIAGNCASSTECSDHRLKKIEIFHQMVKNCGVKQQPAQQTYT